MRPINLIPPEERRSHGATSRTGPLAYLLVGALVALLGGVVLVVLASNDIAEREDRIVTLEARKTALQLRADRLAPYTNFHTVAEERTQTVYSLADSRFDWPRVIRQIARVLPPRVFFQKISASASPGVSEEGGGSSELNIIGPAMTMIGCAPGQKGVAAFAAALKDIDGVTRVGLNTSARLFQKLKPDEKGAKRGPCGGTDATVFEIAITFDAAPPSPNDPETAEAAPAGAEAGVAPAPEETESTEGEAASSESVG
jgi:Tfp pilus assembly protein PilN